MENSTRSGGVGFPALLTLLFIGLKLAGVITWSWLWVLAPLWITFAIGLVIALPLLLIAAVISNRNTTAIERLHRSMTK